MRACFRFFVACLVMAAAVCAFTMSVNPLGLWPNTGALFPKKTERINSVRLVKAYDLFRQCPDHLITGMSTLVWGIDPATYPVTGATLYNGGIVGSNMIEQYEYVLRYLDQCPQVKRVYFDLNMASIQTYQIAPRDSLPSRLQGRAVLPGDFVFTTFSKSAIEATWRTLSSYRSGLINEMVYDRGDGFHHLIETTNSPVYSRNFWNFVNVATRSANRPSPMLMAHFKEMIRILKKRNIETVVFMGPEHMLLQYQFSISGYSWPRQTLDQDDRVKRELASVTDFYDFNLNNEILSEDIENARFFIDQIHYRPRLGHMVLRALNGDRAGMPDNFGVLVTAATVEQNITEQHDGIAQWKRDYPQTAARVDAHFAKQKPQSIRDFELAW